MRADRITIDHDELNEMVSKFSENGAPIVTDAKDLLSYNYTTVRALFQKLGVYVWPTNELISWLKANLPDLDKTIEIGSGNGVIAKSLGVKATDSFMQSTRFEPKTQEQAEWHNKTLSAYKVMQQNPVTYGSNVEQLDAIDAMLKYKPKHVFGCYITHKFKDGMEDGNMLGVNEDWLFNRRHIQTYIVVGNLNVHQKKPLLLKKHKAIALDGLVLRAAEPQNNRIFVWEK